MDEVPYNVRKLVRVACLIGFYNTDAAKRLAYFKGRECLFRMVCEIAEADVDRVKAVARCMRRRGVYAHNLSDSDCRKLCHYFACDDTGNLHDWLTGRKGWWMT